MALSLSTIASIVLVLLKLADKFTDYLQAKKYRDEGYEKAVAEYNEAMLRKSNYAKAVQEHVNSLPDSVVDQQLRELEPSGDIPAAQSQSTDTGSRK